MLNETQTDPVNAISQRAAQLGAALDDRDFRASYMAHHLRAFLADQIRALRSDLSQREFGDLLGKPQSVVSRLEDEAYGKVSLQTLIDIATQLDIALNVRFVDFPTFLRVTSDFSDRAVAPHPYAEAAREEIARMVSPEVSVPVVTTQFLSFSGDGSPAPTISAYNDNVTFVRRTLVPA